MQLSQINIKKTLIYVVVTILTVVSVLGAAFIYSRPWDQALFLEPFHRFETNEKIIALTFDDGPSTSRTPALLALLAKYEVNATFFMLGQNIEKYPEVAQQVFDAGHLIGNHSYDHPKFYLRTPAFTQDQISRTDQLIKNLGQNEVKYFRPPNSAKFIVLPLVLRSQGKTLVTGTYDPPAEYQSPYPGELVAQQVIENTQPGAIIYLHDGKEADVEDFYKVSRDNNYHSAGRGLRICYTGLLVYL